MRKSFFTAAAAVADIPDGASILVGGFGVLQGWPHELLVALRERGGVPLERQPWQLEPLEFDVLARLQAHVHMQVPRLEDVVGDPERERRRERAAVDEAREHGVVDQDLESLVAGGEP